MPLPRVSHSLNFAGLSPARTLPWLPALARFGVAAGIGVVLFVSDVPIVRRDVFAHIPVMRTFYPYKEPED